MKRLPIIVIAALAAGPALAHPGHLGELAGHSHWIALGALVAAAAIAAALAKMKGSDEAEEADDEADGEEEAAAQG